MEGPYHHVMYRKKNKSADNLIENPFMLTGVQAIRLLEQHGLDHRGIDLILKPIGKKNNVASDWLMKELGY